jgi:hypothetical protein
MTPEEIKKLEDNSEWWRAAREWLAIGRNEDADACKLIAESNDRGDAYRARVLHEAGPEPDKTGTPHAWVKWYDKQHAIYNEIFRSK